MCLCVMRVGDEDGAMVTKETNDCRVVLFCPLLIYVIIFTQNINY